MKQYKRENRSDVNSLTLCEETLQSIFVVVRCAFTWLSCGCLNGSPIFPSAAFIVSLVMQNYLSQPQVRLFLSGRHTGSRCIAVPVRTSGGDGWSAPRLGRFTPCGRAVVDCVWNVMAHAQKPNFVFRWNGRVNLNRRGRQFSRLLAAEVYASAVVMLDTPCSEVVWRVLATHSIRKFPLHFPSRASPCAITFQLDSTNCTRGGVCPRAGLDGCSEEKVSCPHQGLNPEPSSLHRITYNDYASQASWYPRERVSNTVPWSWTPCGTLRYWQPDWVCAIGCVFPELRLLDFSYVGFASNILTKTWNVSQ